MADMGCHVLRSCGSCVKSVGHQVRNPRRTRPLKCRVNGAAWSTKMQGTVKWFSNTRGYGFIGRDDGPDVFVHYTGIVGEGYKTLNEGGTVEFEIVQGPKGSQAGNVTRILNSTPHNQVVTDKTKPYAPPRLTADDPKNTGNA